MSPSSQPLDNSAAHRFFSTHCFNEAWVLIDKPNRTEEEDRLLLALSFASLWHWTRRDDCLSRNLSIGYWQISRIFALLGDGANAKSYGDACMEHSLIESPFFLAYAHEALARAAALNGDSNRCAHHLTEARKLGPQISDADERAALEKDLLSITLP